MRGRSFQTVDESPVDRVSRDIHDGPLQDVFATMLRLDLLARNAPPDLEAELVRLSSLQQGIIGRLREICALRDSSRPHLSITEKTPRWSLEKMLDDAAIALGFVPRHRVDEGFNSVRDTGLVSDVLFATRECLSNVARHAFATSVSVTVSVTNLQIIVRVEDDGVGFTPNTRRGNGIGNLQQRAARNGGTCTFSLRPAGGTIVDWRVPLERMGV